MEPLALKVARIFPSGAHSGFLGTSSAHGMQFLAGVNLEAVSSALAAVRVTIHTFKDAV